MQRSEKPITSHLLCQCGMKRRVRLGFGVPDGSEVNHSIIVTKAEVVIDEAADFIEGIKGDA